MQKILVIDDEIKVCQMIEAALRPRFAMTTTNDGESGFKAARTLQPDLIICDVNMAGIDGYQTLHLLRDHPITRATPCILMTGQSSETGMRKGMELGADDYLPKPFKAEQLRAAVDARISKQKWLREEALQKFQRLQKALATSIPNQMLGPLDDLLSLTELIGKGYREFELHEIIAISRDAHRTGLRVRQHVENCLLLAELMLLAEDPARPSSWRAPGSVHVVDIVEPTVIEVARQHERLSDLQISMTYCLAQVPKRNLQKIVQEILDNAFKFSPPKRPIEVRVFPKGQESIVEITDRGPGMTEEQIAGLDAFVRFEQKLVETRGCGLGLAVAKQLTQLSGGRLSVRAGDAGGTLVQIVMPSIRSSQ